MKTLKCEEVYRQEYRDLPEARESLRQFIDMVISTERGWMLIGAGAVIGAILGWIVLALSIVSLPLLVDCNVSAADALSTSWRAAHANMGVLIRWGLIVTLLLVLGSIPLFVGLAFVLPWLGYSTWHLYTRLVDRDSIPAKRRRSSPRHRTPSAQKNSRPARRPRLVSLTGPSACSELARTCTTLTGLQRPLRNTGSGNNRSLPRRT